MSIIIDTLQVRRAKLCQHLVNVRKSNTYMIMPKTIASINKQIYGILQEIEAIDQNLELLGVPRNSSPTDSTGL